MKNKKQISRLISSCLGELEKNQTMSDKLRLCSMIESYLCVLGYFGSNKTINDVLLVKKCKFLWFSYSVKESYSDCMIRYAKSFLNSLKGEPTK